ncbi:MAG: endonuclease/exonuclease/phosphatase family protein [Ferruginibacter sp.]
MAKSFFRKFAKRIFIVSNIFVALLFLLGCYSGYFNPKYFWFIGFFTLASFYLLILLIGFIFLWLFADKKLALISVLAIGLAWKPLGQLLPLRTTPPFTLVKHPSHLRVMTWNVEHFEILEYKKHPEKKQEMLNLINEYQPDIVCFQEMVAGDSPKAINPLSEFTSRLGMPYYHYAYNRKLDFDDNHHFGIIIMSRIPLLSKHTFSYEPNNYNSIFEFVDIVKNGDTFRIVNLHLQSMKFSSGNLSYIEKTTEKDITIKETRSVLSKLRTGFYRRKTQSEHLKKELNKSPFPLIVCGDFNDVPNSYAYTTIGKGLKNAFADKGTGIGRTFYSISPTLRIDNIFVDEKFTVEQYLRVKKKISDHFPIIADLYYNKPQ